MFRFYAERLWDIDENRNILSALVQWTEDCEDLSELLDNGLMVIAVGCLGALGLALSDAPNGEILMFAAMGLFVLGVSLFVFGHHLCTAHCELTFERDGRITMPRGWLGNRLFGPQVLGLHSDISSVQSQETEVLHPDPNKPKRYEVWLYFHSGSNFSVAGSLYKPQAYKVAVLLQQALADIRQADARLPQQAEAWAEVVVD
jgi:hypothetical protein